MVWVWRCEMARWMTLWIPAALGLVSCEQEFRIVDRPDLGASGDRPDLSPPTKTDQITQVIQPEVDILWVVDDSGSMCDKQAQLAQAFPMFMEYFLDSGLDYHIGVTSMDTTTSGLDGRLRAVGPIRYITPDTPDPIEIFSQMARLGCSGSPVENGSMAVYHAIQQPTPLQQQANAGFLRDQAALHIIALTDERDNSYFESVGWSFSVTEFINWLNGFKGDPDIPVSFSAIAGPVPNGCARGGFPPSIAEACVPYPFIVSEVGRRSVDEESPGEFFSICQRDWEPFLDRLGLLASSLRREYFMSESPVPSSIEVVVETLEGEVLEGIHDRDLPEDFGRADVDAACVELGAARCFAFSYDPARNSVQMINYMPPPQSQVKITYVLRSGQVEVSEFEWDAGATANP